MNFNDLQESVWRYLGFVDSGQRQNYYLQEIRDAINASLDELASTAPFLWPLVRESSISVVAGTQDYYLDDWCRRVLSFWTEGTGAHKVTLHVPREADRNGLRQTGISAGSLGPWDLTLLPRNSSAVRSGTAASATEAATAITGVSGASSADIGRLVRLNGEDMDYKILSVTGTTQFNVDRAIRGRLSNKSTVATGSGYVGTGSGYSAVSWELGPPGRLRIRLLPSPTSASTLYYRYVAIPRRMLNLSDVPEIPQEYHHLLWKGALCRISKFVEDSKMYPIFKAEFEIGLEKFKDEDIEDVDCNEPPPFVSSMDTFDHTRKLAPDVSFRNYPRG